MLEFCRRLWNETNDLRLVKEVPLTEGYPASMKIHWQILLAKMYECIGQITDFMRGLTKVRDNFVVLVEDVSFRIQKFKYLPLYHFRSQFFRQKYAPSFLITLTQFQTKC